MDSHFYPSLTPALWCFVNIFMFSKSWASKSSFLLMIHVINVLPSHGDFKCEWSRQAMKMARFMQSCRKSRQRLVWRISKRVDLFSPSSSRYRILFLWATIFRYLILGFSSFTMREDLIFDKLYKHYVLCFLCLSNTAISLPKYTLICGK